ncbi:MAG TPA: cell envelope integrity protein CreD [Rariglobus sp.]|jgi:inner membrane protein|nr:cell envelope integrity protein CreD [Rariglobus sp.]HTL69555.1 cell envelope integrity protein CreD [Lacunisphaera sp.]
MNSPAPTPEPPLLPTPAGRRLAVFLKVGFICLLIPFLLIPLAMTNGVLHERQGYQLQATREIAAIWGRQQLVTGPVLAVPYAYRTTVIRPKVVAGRKVDVEETELVPAVAYFLPESLAIQGAVDPETRHRGIYEAVVYTATLKLTGSFEADFAAAGIAADQVSWDKAEVLFGVSDLRGVRSVSPVTITPATEPGAAPAAGLGAGGPRRFPFESADGAGSEGLSLAARTDGAITAGKFAFALEAVLQGSERLDFVPAGKSTQVGVRSPWPAPSFGGAYLPVKRTVGSTGFTADWEVSHFSRGFGQSWTSRGAEGGGMANKFAAAGFGVAFAQPVNAYSMVERAQKYGVLFFVLVFAVFFLFEITARLRIHPLQYAMVGAALCLFFLGFLALSEFWSIAAAYGAAAAACTLLVALYAWTFLRSGGRTLVIGGGLAATYGYLYFVLQSEDYALVAGTAALFAALALVMFGTRRINWYALDLPGTENAGAGAR